jgi:hypothetical protein
MFISPILLYSGQYLKTGSFKMLIKSKGLGYVFLPHVGEALNFFCGTRKPFLK